MSYWPQTDLGLIYLLYKLLWVGILVLVVSAMVFRVLLWFEAGTQPVDVSGVSEFSFYSSCLPLFADQ